MKIPILALILAPLAAFAVDRPLHWTSDISRVADMRFDAMHGDALDFKVDFNAHGKPVDLADLDATLYWQTNGMGSAWWSAPGAISNSTARALFPSSADPGDKTLNFYLALSDGSNVVYGASARVTFRNSPGISPNMIAPPIVTIDFNTIEVLNSPYYDKAETEAKIVELAPAPGDYATVSNAAMSAVQPTNMPMLASYPMRQWGENIYIAGDECIDVSPEYHGTIAHRIFDGWHLSLSTDFWDQFSDVALSGSYNDLTDTPEIPSPADFSTSNEMLVATIEATAPAPGNYATVSNKAMTALQSYTETDPTVPSWAKSQTQPLPPDYATISNKAMTALQSYTETDPTVPAWAKNQTKPSYTASEVGVNDYANVSNKAMTALQSYTESDPTISSWAKGAQKPTYTASEVGAISKTGTTVTGSGALIKFVGYGMNPTTGGTAITLSSSSDANMTSYLYGGVAVKRNGTNSDYLWDTESPNGVVRRSEIDGMATSEELEASDRIIYAIVEGSNVLDVVTNYDSVVNIPERMLVQIDTNGERKVVWRESTRHNATIEQLTAALDNATNALATATAALLAAKADRAWGKYTSGLGEDAPADTLWISHPNTVLAGGLDWMKNVTTGGDIFVLTSNGMALEFENNPTNAAFFNLASNGETIFRIEKTDERAVYVNISDVDVVGNYLLVGFQSWAWPTHPLLRVKEDLADAEWLKEEDAVEGEWAGIARFAWSGDGVNVPFVVSVENLTGGSKIFAGFSYTAPGETKIIHNGVTDLSKGVFYNGKTYKPVVNGNKIELVEQQ